MHRFRSRLVAVLAAPVLVFSLVACGDDDGGGGSPRAQAIRQVSDLMMADDEAEMMGFDREAADCVAAAVVDAVGAERVLAELDESGDLDGLDDDDLDPEIAMALVGAIFECIDIEDMMGDLPQQ